MPRLELSQAEADALLAMKKVKVSSAPSNYPDLGGSITLPLASEDGREEFLLDISRGRIDLMRGKYQNRSHQVIVLARLDFGGPPHRNPDDIEVPCPHLHLYCEGFADKIAIPLPAEIFTDPANLWQTLQQFMAYCNIIDPPAIHRGLFQ